MGPAVRYYGEKEPLPFAVDLALAYKPDARSIPATPWSINAEIRMHRVFVKNYFDRPPEPFYKALYKDWNDDSFRQNMKEIEYHLGFEVNFGNLGAFRMGQLIDIMREQYELHWGIGVKVFSKARLDWYYIHAPEGFMRGLTGDDGATGERDGQWGLSGTTEF